jgi:hypothetical protein
VSGPKETVELIVFRDPSSDAEPRSGRTKTDAALFADGLQHSRRERIPVAHEAPSLVATSGRSRR